VTISPFLLRGAIAAAVLLFAGPSLAQPEDPSDPASPDGAPDPGDQPDTDSEPEGADEDDADEAPPNDDPEDDDRDAAAAELAKAEAVTDEADAEVKADEEPPKDAPVPKLGEHPFREQLKLTFGPLLLRPLVQVQVQAVPFAGQDSLIQNGDIADRGGFRLRRARTGFRGDFDERAAFALSVELSSDAAGAAAMHDAWFGYTEYPFLSAYAGAQTVPVSRSALMSSGQQGLLERPLTVRSMAPLQQVGAIVAGSLSEGLFSYAAGIFNGYQRKPRFYEGYEQSFAPLGNQFDGMAYGGRIALEPAAPIGDHMMDVHHSKFAIGVGGGYQFSDGGARDIHIAGGDVLVHASGLHVLAEALWTRSEPESRPTTSTPQLEGVSSYGIIGEVGYMIIARTVGLTGRFELIDPNTEIEDESDDWLATIGASFFFVEEILRLSAEYTHREEMKGVSLDNDSFGLGLQLAL